MAGPDKAFDVFFNPRGVMLVGASRDPQKLGYGMARNLATGGYPGAVYLVNPDSSGELFGRDLYPTVGEVPDPVDLAVVLVPAASVPGILEQCGRRDIKAVIIASGGFREYDQAGASLEAECVRVAGEHGIRLLGPNCIGTIDTHLGLNTTFLAPPGPKPGEVAFISHSGAICAAVIDWSAGQGFGFSRLVSLGNQADIDESDALQMVVDDPSTKVVTMYLETVADGRRFVEEVGRTTKPVIALKMGKSEAGRRAVVSHTGALTGSEDAYRAAFRRAGVIHAETTESMFDAARALAWAPLPPGRRIAVLTNAGGPGVTAADALEPRGLVPAELSASTRRKLADSLPKGAGVANPVDMLASARPHQFAGSLEILLSAPEVDGVLVVFPPPPMFPVEQVADALVPVIGRSDKPVLVAIMGDQSIGTAVRRFRTARIPDFRFPERAVAAMAALTDRAEMIATGSQLSPKPKDVDEGKAARILANSSPGWLASLESMALVGAYGVATAPATLVTTADEAVVVAASLDGPVALKVDAPGIVHKSEVGGVHLGLSSGDEIRDAFDSLVSLSGSRSVNGVYVQPMAESGHDVIVGGVRDAQFGPLIMFGSGGIEVEVLDDVEFALAPITETDVNHLISQTRAGRRLPGYRGIPAGDRNEVERVLRRVGWLLADQPQVCEIEINPLRALTPGSGAIALDVRVLLD